MDWLITEDRGQVRWVTLNRPERRNAVPVGGWEDLAAAFADFEESDQRILVVTGAGGDFCAGADLDTSRLEEVQSVVARHKRMKAVGGAAMALHRLAKPTIAAVDGVAVGAGLNLALGCDLVIATERARFSEIFVRRGLTLDFGGSWLLPRIVGLQKAKELALTGRILSADEAAAVGLVTDVVAVPMLNASVASLAEEILAGAPRAQGFIKQTLNAAFHSSLSDALTWEGQSQAILLGTEDAAEGVLAFLEKRDPVWKGR